MFASLLFFSVILYSGSKSASQPTPAIEVSRSANGHAKSVAKPSGTPAGAAAKPTPSAKPSYLVEVMDPAVQHCKHDYREAPPKSFTAALRS